MTTTAGVESGWGYEQLDRLQRQLAERERAGLLRRLSPRVADESIVDLASNDYLGLSKHPAVVEAAQEAATEWGVGSTGSRLVTGTTALHRALERDIAEFLGAEAALVVSSGYLANIAVLGALGGPDVTIVSDAHNHASIIDAARLSRSNVVVVPHSEPGAIDRALADASTRHALVVTESVFSVEGDAAPLVETHEVCRRHAAMLVVDEAHSIGVVHDGRGALFAAGLVGRPDVVCTITLSKALGGQGGAVVGHRLVIDQLINTARPVIFDTALGPPLAAAARAALDIIGGTPSLCRQVQDNALVLERKLRQIGVPVSTPSAAIMSVPFDEPTIAPKLAAQCLESSVRVAAFRPPTVPTGTSVIRFAANAHLSGEDMARVVESIAPTARPNGGASPGQSRSHDVGTSHSASES